MGVDLQIGLSLLDSVDDLLEGFIGQLLAGQNRQRVTLLFLLHAVDAIERDLLHVGADHVDGAGDDTHDVTGVNRRAVRGAGIAHGTGDLAIADLADGVDHGGDGVLELGIGQDREQRGEGLRNGLGGNDGDLLVGTG